MSKINRIFAALLAALTLLPLAACAGDGKPAETTAAPVETAGSGETTAVPETKTPEQEAFDALPDTKYDYEFRVFMRKSKDWQRDLFADEITGDVVNDAVFKRNGVMQERFGVTFQLLESSNAVYETDAMNVLQAQSDEYDLIVPHARSTFAYAESGYLVDWNTIEGINLDAAWWDQDARKSFTINDHLYMMIGDISYLSLANSTGMLFNKELAAKFGLPDLYETVKAGKWTYDEFARLAEMCQEDLNGDSKINYEHDRFGYVTYIWNGPIQALYSGGGRLIERDGENTPVFALNTERNIAVYEKYFSILDRENSYLEGNRDEGKSKYDSRLIFTQGRALFRDSTLSDIELMREMTDDYGIIPCPKFDENVDRYYANVDSGTNLYSIPYTNPDLARTAVILEAMAIMGRQDILPAYYEVALQSKYSRDDVSSQMLDLIREGRVFDLGYYNQKMLGHEVASTGYILARDNIRSFASTFKMNEKMATIKIKQALGKY